MYKILVVDDEPDFRKTLSGLLTDEGYVVRSVANEGEALKAVLQEPFDFALIDVRLHDGGEEDESGLSLAMAFRALDLRTRVILLTQYARTPQIVRAIRYLGAVDFIEKTQDVGAQVLDTIAREAEKPTGETITDVTRLNLSLETGQPVRIRAQGHHACSKRTRTALYLKAERYVRRVQAARRDPDNLRLQVTEIGRNLWQDIFELPEISNTFFEARGKSKLLSLLFETPREFLGLPLEFLRSEDPPEYVVLQHPLARFICDAAVKRKVLSPQMLALKEKLDILIIASNTRPRIDGVDAETRQLSDLFRSQNFIPINVNLIPTERATYERVREELRRNEYDIIHYAGHGFYQADSPEESSLCFWTEENRRGDVVPMKATELRLGLESSGARLVYMSSCYGATTGSTGALLDDDFLGLADAIAQAGVPSVLGFRWPVSDVRAPQLALSFYKSLLEQGSPEIALWKARCELAASDRKEPTWLSPILIHQE